ncbi:MAG: GAF and ANTAR domain-containing protein [Actinomycetota bacterium]|nr:GAF and ANTAR domain-containing protein [Actinomycetota bacterium]
MAAIQEGVPSSRRLLSEGLHPMAAELGAVTQTLLGIARAGIDERLLAGQICAACVAGLAVDGAGFSVLTGSPSRETLWATDPTAQLLEDLQFSLNEGACMEAATTGSPVLVPDLRQSVHATRWPMFVAAVVEQTEIGALFALPLEWGTSNVGVLDLYRIAPGQLNKEQYQDALAATDLAALMMLGIRTDPIDDGAERDGDRQWMDIAVGGRAEIHQAAGMVLVQLGVSVTDALARMRGHAFVNQRLLIDVARDVVARQLVFTEDMG